VELQLLEKEALIITILVETLRIIPAAVAVAEVVSMELGLVHPAVMEALVS
jgi:hypothetical protein